jgi:hypothetical protein
MVLLALYHSLTDIQIDETIFTLDALSFHPPALHRVGTLLEYPFSTANGSKIIALQIPELRVLIRACYWSDIHTSPGRSCARLNTLSSWRSYLNSSRAGARIGHLTRT